MPEKLLIPSVDMRLGSLLEYQRRRELEADSRRREKKPHPTITISREFGCESFPVAERLRELMEKKSGESWVIMDKALLEKVARDHDLSENVLQGLGEKNPFLDEFLATFTPRWKSDKDHYRLLSRQIFSLAEQGNVIFIGRGSAIVTQSLKNCIHFRLFASQEFKTRSISRRLGIPHEEAEKMVTVNQKQRDKFIRDFLDRDARDLSFYHLVFNNAKSSPEKIAHTMAEYVQAV
jgi:cytidylate kinase